MASDPLVPFSSGREEFCVSGNNKTHLILFITSLLVQFCYCRSEIIEVKRFMAIDLEVTCVIIHC